MVHSFCVVLAGGAGRAGALSDRVAAAIAVPDCRHRSGGRDEVAVGGHHLPGTVAGRAGQNLGLSKADENKMKIQIIHCPT